MVSGTGSWLTDWSFWAIALPVLAVMFWCDGRADRVRGRPPTHREWALRYFMWAVLTLAGGLIVALTLQWLD